MKQRLAVLGVGLMLLCGTQHPMAAAAQLMDETITGAEILANSANVGCLGWLPVGLCVWITCTPVGCDVDTSVKIRHYVPDSIVTAYHVTGRSPWLDTRAYTQSNPIADDAGTNTEGSTMINETALLFKESDVIGSPGVAWINALANSGYMCDPITTPYRPYMLSAYDPTWRLPIIELPWTLRYILRYVRSGLIGGSTWGPMFPRGGFIHQGHDYKAGAVIAQRAADITTRNRQPHLYWPMREDDPDQGQWPPEEVIEGDVTTHKWQQLVPSSQSGECRVFADQSDQASGPVDPFSARLSPNTGYVFNLWRPYRCCEQEGAVLLFHFGE